MYIYINIYHKKQSAEREKITRFISIALDTGWTQGGVS